MGVVAVAVIAAAVLTFIRQRRESELEIARPQAMDAQRLRLALGAGGMGTWRWNLVTGEVNWDEQLEGLYGLEPGTFDGSMAMYRSLFHPDDRDRAIATVNDGMARDVAWRFDHRVVWADGSVHWLEGSGEPVHDARGVIVGATGICVDIDERRALLDAEQASRTRLRTLLESSEQLGALDDPDRVLDTICQLAATRIGAWATVMRVAPDGSLERSNVAHRDPALAPPLREIMERLSDDGDSVKRVLETGEPLLFTGLTEGAAETLAHDPELRAKFDRVGFESCVLVPLTVAGRRLAVLSIGDERREGLGEAEVELAVDLGRRGAIGARACPALAGEPAALRSGAPDRRLPADDDHPRPTARARGRRRSRPRTGRPRSTSTSAATGTTRSRPSTAASSSSSVTSPGTAWRRRASWGASATRCARTRSRTPTPPASCCDCTVSSAIRTTTPWLPPSSRATNPRPDSCRGREPGIHRPCSSRPTAIPGSSTT